MSRLQSLYGLKFNPFRADVPLEAVIVTPIATDGTLSGPDVPTLELVLAAAADRGEVTPGAGELRPPRPEVPLLEPSSPPVDASKGGTRRPIR